MEPPARMSLRDITVQLTKHLRSLARHYSAGPPQRLANGLYATDFSTCIDTCVDAVCIFQGTVQECLHRSGSPIPGGWPTAVNICTIALDSGLEAAFLSMLRVVLPLLQGHINKGAAASIPGSARSATAAGSSQRSVIASWEWHKDLQCSMIIVVNVFSALVRAMFASSLLAAPVRELALRLLQGGILLQVLDSAAKGMLMHILHTKVLNHMPSYRIDPARFYEVSESSLRVLNVILDLPLRDQLCFLRYIPANYLDTACRLGCASIDSSDPANGEGLLNMAVNLTFSSNQARLQSKYHSPELAATLAAYFSSPTVRRVAHLALKYIIPRTAVGPITRVADSHDERGGAVSPENLKQHSLLIIKNSFEGMLRQHDSDWAKQLVANNSSSDIMTRLGWADADPLPEHSHVKADCDVYSRVWDCGDKAEDRKLLLPRATTIGSLISEIVRIGVWDIQNWGEICCKLVGQLLRQCWTEACNQHMRRDLGRVMTAVARLASAAALHVLQQRSTVHGGQLDTRGSSVSSETHSRLQQPGEQRVRKSHHLVGTRSSMAASLQLLVTHMLRVGKFCDDGTHSVTGFVGKIKEGGWKVTIKNEQWYKWLLMPGALVTLELPLRVSGYCILHPSRFNNRELISGSGSSSNSSNSGSGGSSSSGSSGSGGSMSPDLIPVIMAHTRLLQRSWLVMISEIAPQDPTTQNPRFAKYLKSAKRTLSLSHTLCKLLLSAAGLVSDPKLACTKHSNNPGPSPGHGVPDKVSRYEVAVKVEELACGELRTLVRAMMRTFTMNSTAKMMQTISNPTASSSKMALPRDDWHTYLVGNLIHTTSLRLTLMLGRCCALIAAGNRARGWHTTTEAAARLISWNDALSMIPSQEMAGHMGRQVQARVLSNAGATRAAAHAAQADHTFVLTLRSGLYAVLYPEALRACGFDIAQRHSEPTPQLPFPEVEILLTLRQQAVGAPTLDLKNVSETAVSCTASSVLALEGGDWERYVFANLTGPALPGCHNWGCSNLEGYSEDVLPTLLCGGCRRARYCSVQCQQAAWFVGGHKAVCAELAISGQGQPASITKQESHPTTEHSPPPAAVVPPKELAKGFFSPKPSALTSTSKSPTTYNSSTGSSSSSSSDRQLGSDTSCRSASNNSAQTLLSKATVSPPGSKLRGGFFDRPSPASGSTETSPMITAFSNQLGISAAAPQTHSVSVPSTSAVTSTRATAVSLFVTEGIVPIMHILASAGSSLLDKPVVHVSSNSFLELTMLLKCSTCPTIFDLGGQVFHNRHVGSCIPLLEAGHLDVTVDGTCLRNGTLIMGEDKSNRASVRLIGRGVVLEDIRVHGGCGIEAVCNADVTLCRCWVRNAMEGICVSNQTHLTAHDTRVMDCKVCGIRVESSSKADLFNCEFRGSISGITVDGDSSSRVRAQGVRCVDNLGYGVKMGFGAEVAMTNCELKNNGKGAMHVNGEGTLFVLAKCLFDGQAVAVNGGRVEVRGREFRRLASIACAATWP